MKALKLISISILSSVLAISSGVVFADAKTTVNSQSRGNITSTATAIGSGNKVKSDAAVVDIENKGGKVDVRSNHKGNITSTATAIGSGNKAESSATAVKITNK